MCFAGAGASDPFLAKGERKGSTSEDENKQTHFCNKILSPILKCNNKLGKKN